MLRRSVLALTLLTTHTLADTPSVNLLAMGDWGTGGEGQKQVALQRQQRDILSRRFLRNMVPPAHGAGTPAHRLYSTDPAIARRYLAA